MLDAQEILGTPPSRASALFDGQGGLPDAFRRIARSWHPDVNKAPEAQAVFRHLVALRAAAERSASPASDAVRTFAGVDGRTFEMRHLTARSTDVGEVLVGRGSLAYVVEPDLADLAATAAAWRPTYAAGDGGRMRDEMVRFLPAPVSDVETAGGRVMVYRRSPDQMLLSDLVALCDGKVEAVHAAWIASGLMHLCCWLEWAGLSHGWISPDTVLVSPEGHSVALTGPFLFATPFGARPTALPERTLSLVTRAGIPDARAEAGVDLELARATVREALGDPGGGRLLSSPEVPPGFGLWLVTPPATSARADYAGWEAARDRAFGPRKFTRMTASPRDAYGA